MQAAVFSRNFLAFSHAVITGRGPGVPCRGRFSGALNGTFDITLEAGGQSRGQSDLCSFRPRRGERASGRRGRDCALPRGTSSGSHVTSSQRGATRGVREGSCPGRPAPGPSRGMRHGSLEAGAAQPPGLPRGAAPSAPGVPPRGPRVRLACPSLALRALQDALPPQGRVPQHRGLEAGTWALGRHLLHLNLTAT